MKRLLAIARKDALLRFTSPSEWLFFLILPIVFTVVLAGGTGSSGDSRIRLPVVDLAASEESAALVSALEVSDAVRPERMTLAAAEAAFGDRRASALLIIPAEFDLAHLAQGPVALEVRQQPNNMNGLVAAQVVESAAGEVSGAMEIALCAVAEAERLQPFRSDAARQAFLEAALEQARAGLVAAPQRLDVVQGSTQDPVEYDPAANSSAGQLITWVFIPLIGISATFAADRQSGTLRRLFTTPIPRSTYLLGTILGQMATALVQMALLVGFGMAFMGLDWGRSPVALAAMLVAATLAAAALGTALGTFVKTEGQANGLSILLGMVMALLGGCWYPLDLFPEAARSAVKVLPTTWAMEGLLNIVLRGQGLEGVLPQVAVLMGFAALFFAVGVARFRYE